MKRVFRILLPLLCLALCVTALAAYALTPGRLNDGVWYGAAVGRGGPVTVSLRVQNGRIVSAQAEGPQETPAIFEKALSLLDRMIGMDSAEELASLDAVSGATKSSQGILLAAEQAIENAEPDTLPDWLHRAEAQCPGSGFADLPPFDSWAHRPIDWALCIGLTNGISATAFAPDRPCTRGQIVTFLWRAAGSPTPESTEHPFADVDEHGFYVQAMLWAVEQGITNGVDASHFAPDEACTRGQAVTLLWRAAGEPEAVSADAGFSDVPAQAYYSRAVLWALENAVTNGMDAAHFCPDAGCTRAQIVTFCFRAASDIISK